MDNYLEVEANSFDIFTTDKLTPDKTYDPNANITWWERNWLSVVLMKVQFVVGVILCFIPCMQVVGATMIAGSILSGLSMIAEEISPGASKVLSGGSTVATGASAVQTGLSLFSCGLVGWVEALYNFFRITIDNLAKNTYNIIS